MSMRYVGGLVTTTVNPYAANVTTSPNYAQYNGVFTLAQQAQATTSGQWCTDPFFKNTTLLLRADGVANGSQNNTFLAANGAAQGPFADPAGYWSVGFDGSGDTLVVANDAALSLSTGDFTIEAWIFLNSTSTQSIVSTATTSARGYGFEVNSSSLYFNINNGGSNTGTISYSGAIASNVWHHVAVCRSGTVTKLFLNGIVVQTATLADQNAATTNPLYIGGQNYSGYPNYLTGCISNVRVVKGTAVYTSNFTVPTSPLTAISGTSLLTCQSNVICDTSSNKFAITANGNAAVNTKSPFTISEAYNPYSFSGYFDGNGDYLGLPTNSALSLSGDFTIEFFAYSPSTAQQQIWCPSSGVDRTISIVGDGTWGYWDGSTQRTFGAFQASTWAYITLTRTGSTMKGFLNGVQGFSITDTGTLEFSAGAIGYRQRSPAGYYFNGYISNFRIVKGTAVYTSNFTPANEPLTAVSGTSLLTCQSSTFVDNSPNNFTITVNGNTTVATASNSGLPITRNGNTTQGTFSPYGNLWSNYFDGSGDYLQIPYNVNLYPTSSGTDYTAECWVYPSKDTTTLQYIFGTNNTSVANWQFTLGAGEWQCDLSGTGNTMGTAVANQWTHLAMVRSGTRVYAYINGVRVVDVAAGTQSNNNLPVNIGMRNGADRAFTGYISNIRIVNGTALYTSNFTPSTTPLTAVSGTSLLTCQSNRFIDNSSNNFTITRNGDVSVQRFSPFNPTAAYDAATIGGSGYFDGSGDYLSVPDNVAFEVGSSNFTLEGWFYWTGTGAPFLLAKSATSSYSPYVIGVMGSTGNLGFLASTSGSAWNITITPAGTLEKNTWFHVAAVRNGSTFTLYKNGVSIGTATSTSTLWDNTNSFIIGYANTGTDYFKGYSSTVRLVNGTAVYTSNFTPPTAPLTAITNTSLLCNFTNAGIADITTQNDLETVGNAQVSTSVVKYGSGSLAFDGTGDYLTWPALQNTAFGTGDFTVEFWINFSNANGSSFYVIDTRNSGQTANWAIFRPLGNTLDWFNGTTQFTGPTFTTTGTWIHVAYCRTGTSLKLYVNGALANTFTDSANYSTAPTIAYIGSRYSAAEQLNGYIDDLRITKGVARYISNFTPPPVALPVQ